MRPPPKLIPLMGVRRGFDRHGAVRTPLELLCPQSNPGISAYLDSPTGASRMVDHQSAPSRGPDMTGAGQRSMSQYPDSDSGLRASATGQYRTGSLSGSGVQPAGAYGANPTGQFA